MKQIFLGTILSMIMFASPAQSSEKLTSADKIQLQAAMQMSIGRKLVEGQYLYFDADKDKVVTLHPVQAHPMILRMDAHYILCSDFRDDEGKKVNIDFYVTRAENKFVVFDTVVNNRKPIQRMMKAGRASVVK